MTCRTTRAPEYDCCECGRHMIVVAGNLPEPRLCSLCQAVPGWPNVPELRAIFDREGHANPPDLAAVPAWTGRA